MREIKFRGKWIDDNEWVYGYYIVQPMAAGGTAPYIFDGEYEYRIEPETVGQYTGLRDRHGKEIYEGDWLKDTESFDEVYFYKVIWDESNCCFYFKDVFGTDHFGGDDLYLNQIEVIGNVWEHPHLLKGDGNA